ncbi:MAG: hypothetical protein EXS08_10060 [Planctomycetes bacterium]|nr:hypothetical protein [Planctomycetota bacterium]
MIAAALCLALAQAAQGHGPAPGARAAIAGLAGFQSVSTIDYGTVRNRFTATYVFPDRTRWHFDNPAGKVRQHQFYYRHGEQLFAMENSASHRLADEQSDSLLRQMELRRAVMLWPDGFAWEAREPGTQTAVAHADSCCRERPLGTLVAHLANGRPSRVEVRDEQGQTRETLTVREWQEVNGRSWPRVLVVAGEGVGFTETVESLETQIHYLDLFFLPPDQRAIPKGATSSSQVLSNDLVAVSYVPRDLPAGATWDEAVATTRGWILAANEAGKGNGQTFDPVPTIEVGPEGKPVRAWLRLKEPSPTPAEGLTNRNERPGLILALPALAEVGSAALAQLRAAVPPRSKAGVPYLRFHNRPVLPVELVLPLEPAE